MKKILIFVLVAAALICVFLFFKSKINVRSVSNIRSGMQTADFVLGMKDFRPYRLSALTGNHSIVLSFLDTSERCERVKKTVKKAVPSFFKGKDILWFNITREGMHAVIEEQTGNFPMTYRTLYSELPAFYTFSTYPAFVISDRFGIITLLYVGYSPTFMDDIKRETRKLPGKRK